MTLPSGGRPPLRTPTTPGSPSAGPTIETVVVQSVATDAVPPIAICQDGLGRRIPVRIDFQRARGSVPRPNERWVVDQYLGFRTFVALCSADPNGTSSVEGTHSVPGLDDALSAHNDTLDDATARLDEMWTLGTITAVQSGGVTADVTLTDGTSFAAAQVVGSYTPVVNDTVWTSRVDAAGNRAIVGPSSSSTSAANFGAVVASTIAASGRITGTAGFSVSGGATVAGGANITGGLTADTLNVGGWRALFDGLGHSAWITGPGGSGIVSVGTTLFVVTSSDTNVHGDLVARSIVSDTTLTAGVTKLSNTTIANQLNVNGATFTNGLNSSSLQVGAAGAPADRQIVTFDMTATHNIWAMGALFQGNPAAGVTSERRLKDEISLLADEPESGMAFINKLVGARGTWIESEQERRDARTHVWLYVNEIADADPDVLDDRGNPHQIPGGIPWEDKVWMTSGRTYEDRGVLAHGVTALQQLWAKYLELHEQLDALREQLRGEGGGASSNSSA